MKMTTFKGSIFLKKARVWAMKMTTFFRGAFL